MPAYIHPSRKSRRPGSSVSRALENFDVFAYYEPFLIWTSTTSAWLSLIAVALLGYTTFGSFMMMIQGNPSQVTEVLKAPAGEAHAMPDFAINPQYGIADAPYAFNETWYRFNFKQVTRCNTAECLQENSHTTKKTKLDLGGVPCDVVTSEGGTSKKMWCPERAAAIEGQFDDEVFTYLEVALQPCWAYEDEMAQSGRTCANATDIASLFCTTSEHCWEGYSTLSLYLKNRQSIYLEEWESPLYANIEPQSWLGIEAIMRSVEARERNIWGRVTEPMSWLQFASWYTRRAPAGGDKINEILKVYIKTDGVLEWQMLTQFGWVEVGERIGSIWSLLGITLGLVALKINHGKAKLDKLSRRRKVAKFAAKHDLLSHATGEAIEEIRLTVRDQQEQLSRNNLKLMQLVHPELEYMWAMPVVRVVALQQGEAGRAAARSLGKEAAWRMHADKLTAPTTCSTTAKTLRAAVLVPPALPSAPPSASDETRVISMTNEIDKSEAVPHTANNTNVAASISTCPQCHVRNQTTAAARQCALCGFDASGGSGRHDGEAKNGMDAPSLAVHARAHTHAHAQPHEIALRYVPAPTDTTDILFSFDMTSSMSAAAAAVRRNIASSVDHLFQSAPGIRIGIIAHGDYCDEMSGCCAGGPHGGPHVLKSLDFSRSKTAIKAFLDACQQTSGGPFDECYELVLRHAQDLDWRGQRRALLLIGDAWPHPRDFKGNVGHLAWESELEVLTGVFGVEVHGLQFISKQQPDTPAATGAGGDAASVARDRSGRFWSELARAGRGQLFTLQLSPTMPERGFAEAAKLFELFCAAYAGEDALQECIGALAKEPAAANAEALDQRKRWFQQLAAVTAAAAAAAPLAKSLRDVLTGR